MKLRQLMIVMAVMLLAASTSFAAGSQFLVTSDTVVKNFGIGIKTMRVIIIAFTGDNATGAVPNLTLSDQTWTDGTNSGSLTTPIAGWSGYMVEIDCNHAGTEPTEDSEIYIYQNGIDLLGGNGVDQIDNTTERQVFFYFDSVPVTYPVYDDITVTVTQQAAATASATGTIRIIMVPN